jgi:hypothetical protein
VQGHHGDEDLRAVEAWWVQQIVAFFQSKPLALKIDAAKSLRMIVRDLLEQAAKRQKERPGATIAGTVLQHLVGAKLALLVPDVEHHGANVADDASGRAGDFLIADVAIHVTTAPGEALIHKCADNLEHSLRPVIVTTARGTALADGLAETAGIAHRIDVFDAEQFLAGNFYELAGFKADQRRATVTRLIETYNTIVEEHETDPSLRIELD